MHGLALNNDEAFLTGGIRLNGRWEDDDSGIN